MKQARVGTEDVPLSVKSSRYFDSKGLILSQENEKEINIKIIELNKIFKVKVFGTVQYSVQDLPTYLELNSATSVATYTAHKSAISQHLKNKPKYTCNLHDKNKYPSILNYFTNKEIMSLNMDYRENNKCLLSFMLSPYKDSVFFEDTDYNSDCDFSLSLNVPISNDLAISLFFCKCTLYMLCHIVCVLYVIAYTLCNIIYLHIYIYRGGNEVCKQCI